MTTLPANSSFFNEINGLSIYYYLDTAKAQIDFYSANSSGTSTLIGTEPGSSAETVIPTYVAANNGFLYFSTLTPTSFTVYATDGTATGTQVLLSIGFSGTNAVVPGITATHSLGSSELLTVVNGNRWTVYSTNGTTTGTQVLFNFDPPISSTSEITYPSQINGRQIFIAIGDGTYTVYGTDGTTAGTQVLFNFDPPLASTSEITNPSQINGRQIFIAIGDSTYTVYGTDGTTSGTQVLFNFDPPLASTSEITNPSQINGRQIFIAIGDSTYTVYGTDGTTSGTQVLFNFDPPLASTSEITNPSQINGRQIFIAIGDSTYTVYGTDGTTSGTQVLFNFDPPLASTSEITNPSQINGRQIFIAIGDSTYTVYGTDGTTSGTQVLFNFDPPLASTSEITNPSQINGRQIFIAIGDSTYTVYGTDGTTSGTQVLFNFDPPLASTSEITNPSQINGRQIFIAIGDSTYTVYGTDGTTSGTQVLFNFDPPLASTSEITNPSQINGRQIFIAIGDSTYTVYGTDGTTSGTQVLFNFDPPRSSTSEITNPSQINQIAGRDIFIAYAGSNFMVYATDGTAPGTCLLFAGAGSNVTYLQGVDGQYYFTTNSASGISLYVTNLGFSSASLISTAPAGSSFSIAQSGTKVLVEATQSGTVTQTYWVNPSDGSVAVAGDDYTWIGPVSGQWNVASNWDDMTAGANPAIIAPGAKDSVTINSTSGDVQLIGGNGAAAYLALNGEIALTGTVTAGALSVESGTSFSLYGGLINNVDDIEAGGTIMASSATLDGAADLSVSGSGSALDVSGTLSFLPIGVGFGSASPTLSVSDGAAAQLNAVSVGSSSSIPFGIISIDSVSAVEIGTLGDAALGAVTIDDGASVVGSIHISGNLDVAAGVSDIGAELSASGTALIGAGVVLGDVSGSFVTLGMGDTISNVSATTLAVISAGDVVNGLAGGSATILAGATVNGTVNVSGTLTDDGSLTLSNDSVLAPGSTLTFSNEWVPPGILTGNGAVQIAAGASVALNGDITGTLDLIVGKNDNLTLWDVSNTNAISLSGSDILTLETLNTTDTTPNTTLGALQSPITGFDASDAIILDAAITSATYVAGSISNTGELVLDNGTTVVTTLNLDGNYSGDTFLVLPISSISVEIVIAATSASGISPGSKNGDNYTWIGPVSGQWNVASNWDDMTAGANPAIIAPGAKDSVTINSTSGDVQLIGGNGAAAYLALNGEIALTGTVTAGALSVESGTSFSLYGGLINNVDDIEAGGTIMASSATLDGAADLSVSGSGSALDVSGTLSFLPIGVGFGSASPTLSVSDGAAAQLNAVSVGSSSSIPFGIISIDSVSAVEIGTLGDAALGAVTIDDGASVVGSIHISGNLDVAAGVSDIGAELSASGTALIGAGVVLGDVSGSFVTLGTGDTISNVSATTLAVISAGDVVNGLAGGSATILAGATVNGTVNVSGTLTDDGSLTLSNDSVLAPGSTLTFSNEWVPPGILTGNGAVQIAAGASVALNGDITGTLDLIVGKNDNLTLWDVSNTNAISLSGSDILTLETLNTTDTTPNTTLGALQSPITGFDASDAIILDAAITSATYVAGSISNTGELVLDNGTTVVTTLNLDGNYSGDTFLVLPISSISVEIVIAATSASGISPGSKNGDNYTWIGPVSGQWNVASNWDDMTAGANPAIIAPGAKDSVTINSTSGDVQLIGGNGAAAYLALNGEIALTGTVTAGALSVESGTSFSLYGGLINNVDDIEAGGTIMASSATLDGAADLSVSGSGSALDVSGTLSFLPIGVGFGSASPTLSVSDGAAAQLNAVSVGSSSSIPFGIISIDSVSAVEIGTLGDAALGAVTIDDGASVVGSIHISGNLDVAAGVSDIGAELSASGTALIGAGVVLGDVSGSFVTLGTGDTISNVSATTLAVISAGDVVNGLAGGSATILAGATVNGTVNVSGTLTDDGSLTLSNDSVLAPGSTLTFSNEWVPPGILTGNGAVQIAAGASVALNGDITGTLDLIVGKNDNLTLWDVSNTNAISLSGSDILTLETLNTTDTTPNTTLGALQSPITGFDASDAIILDAAITSATYVAGSISNTGELVLDNGTTAVTTLNLDGHFSGNNFFVQTVSSNEIEVGLSSTINSGGTIDILSGETLTNSLIYSGGYENVAAGAVDTTPTLAGGALEIVNGATIDGSISFSGTGSTLVIDPATDGSTAVPHNTISGFAPGDTIQLSGVPYVAGEDTYTVATEGTLTVDANGTFYNLLIAGAKVGEHNFVLSGDLTVTEVACYAAGSLILTPAGSVPIERLCAGDTVITVSPFGEAKAAEIIWTGHRHIDFREANMASRPILIRAGALEPGVPERDLRVSPHHGIYLEGALYEAEALMNGASILRDNACQHVTYHHIELAAHSLILAEGCVSETYLDTGNRNMFAEFDGPIQLHPIFRTRGSALICAPIIRLGGEAELMRNRLAARFYKHFQKKAIVAEVLHRTA